MRGVPSTHNNASALPDCAFIGTVDSYLVLANNLGMRSAACLHAHCNPQIVCCSLFALSKTTLSSPTPL